MDFLKSYSFILKWIYWLHQDVYHINYLYLEFPNSVFNLLQQNDYKKEKKLHQNKCFCEKLFNEHDVLCASLIGQHI